MELLDKIGEKEKRNKDESEPHYLDRVMGLLRLTAQEKEHARRLLIARQDFEKEEDEMLGHFRLEMHTNFLKNPSATKKMTTEDKEKLLEKHTGPVSASKHAMFGVVDRKKVDAYWKHCRLDKKDWSHRDDAKNGASNPPKRKRKGSLGEDEFETYSKAFAAQQENVARFEGSLQTTPEKRPNTFRPFKSASPDYLGHMYALDLGYTHVSEAEPNPLSRRVPRVSQQHSPQPAASSSQPGPSSHEADSSSAVRNDPSTQRSQSQPSDQPQGQQNPSTRGGSHDHQHPKPTPTPTPKPASSGRAPRPPGTMSGDRFAKAHLDLPRMPPGVDSIFSLGSGSGSGGGKKAAADGLEHRPRKQQSRQMPSE